MKERPDPSLITDPERAARPITLIGRIYYFAKGVTDSMSSR